MFDKPTMRGRYLFGLRRFLKQRLSPEKCRRITSYQRAKETMAERRREAQNLRGVRAEPYPPFAGEILPLHIRPVGRQR